MISWLFRKFWRESPRFASETVWSSFNEEDGIETIRVQLDRIATALEILVKE
jgi:hypothetical protein